MSEQRDRGRLRLLTSRRMPFALRRSCFESFALVAALLLYCRRFFWAGDPRDDRTPNNTSTPTSLARRSSHPASDDLAQVAENIQSTLALRVSADMSVSRGVRTAFCVGDSSFHAVPAPVPRCVYTSPATVADHRGDCGASVPRRQAVGRICIFDGLPGCLMIVCSVRARWGVSSRRFTPLICRSVHQFLGAVVLLGP